nr:protein ALP1-like [Tanacetum cinerariifolium]
MTVAIRQSAYGTTPDVFDEYLQMSERTARDCLLNLNMRIIDLYMSKYLRKPTLKDVEKIYNQHVTLHSFPEMLGSIDCVFRVAGANNDNNVLDNSSLFNDLLDDKTQVALFVVNGVGYEKRARDKYHNLEDDAMVKNIFNSGKYKDGVRMKIPSWMIMDEMKLTDHYRMYAVVFGVAMQHVQKVEKYLIAEEIVKLVKGAENVENVEVNSSTLRQDDTQTIPGTRENGKHIEEYISTPSPTTIKSPWIHSTLLSSDNENLQELTKTDPTPSSSTPSSFSSKSNISATNRLLSLFKPKPNHFKRYKSFFDKLQGCYGNLFEHLKTRFMPRKKFNMLAQHLQDIMEESLPTMVDNRVKELINSKVPIYVAHGLIIERQQNQANVDSSVRNYIDHDDPHDDAHLKGENSAKRQNTSEHGTFVFGESSSSQDFKSEPGPEKTVLSPHKFPAIIFSGDDIEERTTRRLGVKSYQQKVNLTAPTFTFPGIEKYKMFSIVSEHVYGIIYKNNKKEKRVTGHQEIHKFCDTTNEDVDYLQLFEEEIEERLKSRDQMRRRKIWPPRVTLGRLLPHARGLEFKPRRGGFPSGAKKEWGLSPKAKVRVLHTAQLDVTVSSNH